MNRWMKTMFLAFAALLLAPAALVQAQKAPAEGKTEAPDPFTSNVEMRFEGLMFIDAEVNGKGPYNFLFDSGASMTILNNRLAEELEIELYDSPMPAQGVGQQEMKMAIADNVRIGENFRKDEVLCGVMDLDHISGELGKHMMGIVGQNLIKHMKRVEVDFSQGAMAITRFKDGEGPGPDIQEMMLKAMLKRGGGFPGIPGMPGDDDEPRKDDKPRKDGKDDEEKEDEFSMGGGASLDLFGDDGKTGAPTGKVEFDYDHFKAMGGLVDVALWFMEAKINGKRHTMFFDTGASSLCVLDAKAAKKLKVPTSFSFGVKGVGESTASEGMLENLEIGGYTVQEPTCSVMDLSNALAQLEMLGNDCAGIIGIPIATRFKRMIVDGEARRVTLEPYAADEANPVDPLATEEMFREAVIRTWNGQASTLGLEGDSIELDDWAKYGLEQGGMIVTEMTKGGAAEKAGLKKDDILVAVVGADVDEAGAPVDMPVRGSSSLVVWACNVDPGTEVVLRIRRGDAEMEVKAVLDLYEWTGSFPEKYRRK